MSKNGSKRIIIVVIICVCIVSIFIGIFLYLRYLKAKDYTQYNKTIYDNTYSTDPVEAFLSNDNNAVQTISLNGKQEELSSIQLNTEFQESRLTRAAVVYAVNSFTNNECTDYKECYYDIVNNTIVPTISTENQTYAIIFKYHDIEYIAIYNQRTQYVSIFKRDNTQNTKAQEDFNKQHKKKDISTYDWSYLMRYREDATDEEIAYTLQTHLEDVKIFDKPRDNIFTGSQFKCRYKYGFVIDNVNYYYDCITDLDNGVVYAYVWRE